MSDLPLSPTPEHLQDGTPKARTPGPKRRAEGWVRTTIPSVAMCFILCMFCKVLIGDTFVLRTSSMEPTMIGRRGGGDRIVLSRLHTEFGGPERWDVLLFQYPNNLSTHYMKRLVGMGNEQLFIRGGDLWVTDHAWTGSLEEGRRRGRVVILRKPESTQRALTDALPVIAAEEIAHFGAEAWRRHCAVSLGPTNRWTPDEDRGHVTVDTDEPALAYLLREARDVILDGMQPADLRTTARPVSGGKHTVGDLSFQIDVRPYADAGHVIVAIADGVGGVTVRAEIAVDGAVSGGPTRLKLDDRVIATSQVRMQPEWWSSIRLENFDDRLRLSIDGTDVATRDYGHPVVTEGAEASRPPSQVRFGITRGRADLRPVSLHRDAYYVAAGQTRFLVPEGCYVFLGDNTASSADSRSWRRTAIRVQETGEILHGDSQGVTATSIMLHDGNPWAEPDGTWRFADRLGNIHTFQDPSEWDEVGTWPTPYVRREWILGRGMCVLWPLDRFTWLR
ncbi:MAG: signal peptidase I [Planctomycetes bacterium]|nr:signal peptidase I [Planctomycetota bacterium]